MSLAETVSKEAPAGEPKASTRAVETPLQRLVADYCESRLATAALLVLLLIVALALLAPLIVPQNPYNLAEVDVLDSRLPPGTKGMAGYTYWLGTDGAGRDLVSAMLYGLRISLAVGVVSCLIATVLGAAVGLIAAYVGGRTESLLMRLVDLQLSLPAILIALMLIAVLGKGVDKIIVALVTVQWAYYARTVRGTALAEMNKEYVEAARCLGFSHARILFKQILPNVLPPLIVQATLAIAAAIIAEASLSFLGLGQQPPAPSWGSMLNTAKNYVENAPWMAVWPGVSIFLLVLSFNLLGDGLRDALDPRHG
jgi:peptide/nickel transport system permease protein